MSRPLAAKSIYLNGHLLQASGSFLLSSTPATSGSLTTLAGTARLETDGGGTHYYPSINWSDRQALASYADDYYGQYGNVVSVDWASRKLYRFDNGGSFQNDVVVDWGNQQLFGIGGGDAVLDWNSKILRGNWQAYGDFQSLSASFADNRVVISNLGCFLYATGLELRVDVEAARLHGEWKLNAPTTGLEAVIGRQSFLTEGQHIYRTLPVTVKATGVHLSSEAVPSGYFFCCDSYEFMCVASSGASGVSGIFTGAFGTHINNTAFSTGHVISGGAPGDRHIFDFPQNAISGTSTGTFLAAKVVSGSPATTHSGVFVFKGHLVKYL